MGVVTRSKSKRRRLEEEAEAGGGEQDDVDLISRLPDDVLGDVITLLPAEDGARTQILSRRWRPLWRSSPLNLKARVITGSEDEAETSGFVSRILSGHPCAARRLSLSWYGRDDGLFPTLDSWLRLPLLGGLHELELFYHSVGTEDPGSPPLVPSTFCCSATLWVLSLCSGDEVLRFPPAEIVSTLDFPCIKQHTLKRVHSAETSLHGILSRCPVLASLLLRLNTGCGCLPFRALSCPMVGMQKR